METQINTKAFRRSLHQVENYHHQGLGHQAEATAQLKTDYQGEIIQNIRNNGHQMQQGDITIRLAAAMGFCWGVERAVSMAYEARQHFPEERIWITGEIIHNPFVNQKLRDMAVEFIPELAGEKDFSAVQGDHVVIIPGAGATFQELQLLRDRGCTIVDTTCPWVVKVWNTVEKHKKVDYTSVIHGKRGHDETLATSSFANRYLVLQNLDDAAVVCDYILHGGEKAEFMAKFGHAASTGFDPDRDLVRVGIANQTTMLKGETEQIGKLFERTLMKKYGLVNLNQHFQPFNTICSATQERQDAIEQLLDQPLDLMVVVGGFNSSNTAHLNQMAIERGLSSFHIDHPNCIGDQGISHQSVAGDQLETANWLPAGPIVVGVTAGASTPDNLIAGTIARLLSLKATASQPRLAAFES
jgi:4-hydroxy-3-methylbut-2-en-1-yl diphosphate reductase